MFSEYCLLLSTVTENCVVSVPFQRLTKYGCLWATVLSFTSFSVNWDWSHNPGLLTVTLHSVIIVGVVQTESLHTPFPGWRCPQQWDTRKSYLKLPWAHFTKILLRHVTCEVQAHFKNKNKETNKNSSYLEIILTL